MNNKRRNMIRDAISKVISAKNILETAMNEEQDSYDSLPDGLQDTKRAAQMQENVCQLFGMAGCLDAFKLEDFYIDGEVFE